MLLAEELEASLLPRWGLKMWCSSVIPLSCRGAAGADGEYELDSHCSEIGADSFLSKCYREAGCLETHSMVCLGILEVEAGHGWGPEQTKCDALDFDNCQCSGGLGTMVSGSSHSFRSSSLT